MAGPSRPSSQDSPNKELDPQKQTSSHRTLWISLGIIALAGAGALFFTPAGKALLGIDSLPQEAGKKSKASAPNTQKFYVNVPDILINLRASKSKTHFLKLCLTLELKSEKDVKYIKDIMPKIVDGFQVYLRELHPDDLKGAEGIYSLKQHLLARVNAETAPVMVDEILFRDMFVQ